MQVAQKNLIYLYCVTQTKPNRSSLEVLEKYLYVGVKIYPIYFQGTYAIVSKVSPDEFSQDNLKKNLTNMEWVEKSARQHEKIIEEIMKDTTVLPFKFGTVFQSEENVEKLLNEHNTEFKRIIEDLDGKEEWGLKIYCDIEKLKETLLEEDEELLKIEREINSSSPGKTFFLKKKKEKLLNAVVNKKLNEYGQDCFERLSQKSLQTQINNLLPIEVTGRKDDMIFNAAFLIDKTKVAEFIQVVDIFKTWYKHKGLEFDCTGPWPPYNFCRLSKEELQNE